MRKRSLLRKWTAILCLLVLWCAATPIARGEDFFTLDVDILDMDALNSNDYVAQNLSASTQGIRVKKYISDSSELAETVRLTLTQMDTQTLVFDKDYGYQGKVFDSGVIYLPYVDNRTIPYLVTLYVGDRVYAMPFMQLQPRLAYNGACTYGIRLRDLENGLSSDWLMGTMLDLEALAATGYDRLDLCASNAYIIGSVNLSMNGGALMVEMELIPSANVEINSLSLYVLTDCAGITGDPAYMGYPSQPLGTWIDVSGASSALLYMPMQVSYDPVGLSAFGYDISDGYMQNQLSLWYQNRSGADEPLPDIPEETPLPEQLPPDIFPTTAPDVPEAPVVDPDPAEQPTAQPPLPEEPPVVEPPVQQPPDEAVDQPSDAPIDQPLPEEAGQIF